MVKSTQALLSLHEALVNNKTSRELIKNVAVGLESDFSKTIEFKEYQFSNELSSVGLENAEITFYTAFDLVKGFAYDNTKAKVKAVQQMLHSLLNRINDITNNNELNNQLVDKLLSYYNNEAKRSYFIEDVVDENNPHADALHKFVSKDLEHDADIDLYRQAREIIDLIKNDENMDSYNKDDLLSLLEYLSVERKTNSFYSFLSFILNLNKNDKISAEFISESITKISTNVPAVNIINNIIQENFKASIENFADSSSGYFTDKYFGVSDIEQTGKAIEKAEGMHREQLLWLESENALLDMLLQDGKDSGLDIFLFFIKLIYSKKKQIIV